MILEKYIEWWESLGIERQKELHDLYLIKGQINHKQIKEIYIQLNKLKNGIK